MRLRLTCLMACLFILTETSAQTIHANNVNVGWDPITQGFYIGLDYVFHNYSVGMDMGSSLRKVFPLNLSLCLDNAWYWGKPNKYNTKTWHVNGRLAFFQILEHNRPSALFIIPAIGKVFYLNEKIGINVELGANFQVLDDPGDRYNQVEVNYLYGPGIGPNFRFELRF